MLPLPAREHARLRAMHQRLVRRHAIAEVEADVAILADAERETLRRILVLLRYEPLQFSHIPRAHPALQRQRAEFARQPLFHMDVRTRMNRLRPRGHFVEAREHGVARRIVHLHAEPADRKAIRHRAAHAKLQHAARRDAVFARIGMHARHVDRPVRRQRRRDVLRAAPDRPAKRRSRRNPGTGAFQKFAPRDARGLVWRVFHGVETGVRMMRL